MTTEKQKTVFNLTASKNCQSLNVTDPGALYLFLVKKKLPELTLSTYYQRIITIPLSQLHSLYDQCKS